MSNPLRVLSSAAWHASSFSLAQRGYTEMSDKLKLSLMLCHKVWQVCFSCYETYQILDYLQFSRCGSSEHFSRVWRHGYPSKPFSHYWGSLSWCRRSHGVQRQPKILWLVPASHSSSPPYWHDRKHSSSIKWIRNCAPQQQTDYQCRRSCTLGWLLRRSM